MSSCERVSIAITCYNAQATIETAVRSAQAQDWPDLEIIVVDDASSDASLQLLQRLAAGDKRIRVIAERANGGVAAARNRLIEAASGTFIAFFDDDDWSHSERVARQVARLTQYEAAHHVDLAACYAARRQRLPGGDSAILTPLGREGAAPCHGSAVIDLVLMGRPVAAGRAGRGACATCSLLARRSVFARLGGFDTAFRRSEDTEFNLRLAREGGHFVGIAQPLVEQTITFRDHKRPARELEFEQLLLRKHQDAFPSPRWLAFMQDWLEARAALSQSRRLTVAALLARLALTKPDLMAHKLAWLGRSRLHAAIGTRRASPAAG